MLERNWMQKSRRVGVLDLIRPEYVDRDGIELAQNSAGEGETAGLIGLIDPKLQTLGVDS